MKLLEIDLPVPDHTTLSRRACGLSVRQPARMGTGELHLIVDGDALKSRHDDRRTTEVAIAVKSLNRMNEPGSAKFVRAA